MSIFTLLIGLFCGMCFVHVMVAQTVYLYRSQLLTFPDYACQTPPCSNQYTVAFDGLHYYWGTAALHFGPSAVPGPTTSTIAKVNPWTGNLELLVNVPDFDLRLLCYYEAQDVLLAMSNTSLVYLVNRTDLSTSLIVQGNSFGVAPGPFDNSSIPFVRKNDPNQFWSFWKLPANLDPDQSSYTSYPISGGSASPKTVNYYTLLGSVTADSRGQDSQYGFSFYHQPSTTVFTEPFGFQLHNLTNTIPSGYVGYTSDGISWIFDINKQQYVGYNLRRTTPSMTLYQLPLNQTVNCTTNIDPYIPGATWGTPIINVSPVIQTYSLYNDSLVCSPTGDQFTKRRWLTKSPLIPDNVTSIDQYFAVTILSPKVEYQNVTLPCGSPTNPSDLSDFPNADLRNTTHQCGSPPPTWTDQITNVTCSKQNGNITTIIQRQWIYTLPCQNDTIQQFIFIQDNIPPVIMISNATIYDQNAISTTNPTATDNYGTPTLTSISDTYLDGSSECKTIIWRKWQAVDSCGHTTNAEQYVTVLPSPPFFPSDVTVECGSSIDTNVTGEASDPVSEVYDIHYTDENTTISTCSQESHISMEVSRHWYLQDKCDTHNYVQMIRITDQTPPVFSVLNKTIVLDCTTYKGQLDNLPAEAGGIPVAMDACDGLVNLTRVDKVAKSAAERAVSTCTNGIIDSWTVERTWIATDRCGNTVKFVQNITFKDNIPPRFVVPPARSISLEITARQARACDETNLKGLYNEALNVSVNDNCDSNVATDKIATTFRPDCKGIIYNWSISDWCQNKLINETELNFYWSSSYIILPTTTGRILCFYLLVMFVNQFILSSD